MNLIKEDAQHYIEKVSREKNQETYQIKWESNGLKHYIVVSGEKSRDVRLMDNENLQNQLSEIKHILISNRQVSIDGKDYYYVSFSELIRNGGLNIQEKPGYYAIYGCEVQNEEIASVYYSDSEDRTINITIEIEIIQSNHEIEVRHGLFKKERRYSGYKQVTIPRGISNISENAIVYYTPDQQPISVPKIILEKGGTFFVSYDENQTIRFISNNRGIMIK